MSHQKALFRITHFLVLFVFLFFACVPHFSYAQKIDSLPSAGQMIGLSDPFSPMVLKGVEVHPEDPFLFDFIVHNSAGDFSSQEDREEVMKLVKYFLTGLSIQEDEMWVNLSPTEQNRIMNESLSQTDLGKELLFQDYILKQVMSTLLYPEENLGREFWSEVYQKVYQELGHTQIEVDTFNKVWIMPETATVVQNNNRAMVQEATLNVLLESDYLLMQKEGVVIEDDASLTTIKEVTRAVILPILKKEINEGKNFAALRQIYHSLILAGWYKNNLQTMLLNQVYADTHKVQGLTIEEKQIREQVYQQYLDAYQKGVFNYVKEEKDVFTNESLPRKYFSGGITDLSVSPSIVLGNLPITSDDRTVSVRMTPLTGEQDPSQSIDMGIQSHQLELIDKDSYGKNRPIKFGTSGERGQYGIDFTWNHVLRVMMGIARYLKAQYLGKTVYLGYDPRQDNKDFVIDASRVLAAYGVNVRIVRTEPTPVPVLALLTGQDHDAVGFVMFTASHSPHTDLGIKLFDKDGGSAGEEITNRVTAYANEGDAVFMADYEKAKSMGMIEEIVPEQAIEQYVYQYLIPRLESVGALDDIVQYIQNNPKFQLILDPMQGTSVRYLQALYDNIGARVGRSFIEMINTDNNDPTFRLVKNEPNPTKSKSRAGLVQKVLQGNGLWLGAATDADADRFGNIDFNGEPILASDMIGMLTYFLSKEQGLQGRVGKSLVTSNFVNHVAEHLSLDLDEYSVGFKHAAKLVREGKEYLVSGEDSCHVLVGFLKESWDDGIAMGLMGLWIVAKTGKTLSEYKDFIQQQLGKKFFSDTITIRGKDDTFKKPGKDLIAKTKNELQQNVLLRHLSIVSQIETITDRKIVNIITMDGIKIVFEDGSWAAFRLSGTEPAIKISVEVVGPYSDDIEQMKVDWQKLFNDMKEVVFGPEGVSDAAELMGALDDEYDENMILKPYGGIDLNLSQILNMDIQEFESQHYQLDSDQIMILRENLNGFVPVFMGESPLELIAQ